MALFGTRDLCHRIAIKKNEFVLGYEGDLVSKLEGTIQEVIYREEGIGCRVIWWKKADQVLDGTRHLGGW